MSSNATNVVDDSKYFKQTIVPASTMPHTESSVCNTMRNIKLPCKKGNEKLDA
jgi:hypothetical protein